MQNCSKNPKNYKASMITTFYSFLLELEDNCSGSYKTFSHNASCPKPYHFVPMKENHSLFLKGHNSVIY